MNILRNIFHIKKKITRRLQFVRLEKLQIFYVKFQLKTALKLYYS